MSATSVELPSEVEDLVGPKNPDACGSRVKPVSPGHSHYNVTDEVIVTNKVSIVPQLSQICQDESVCTVAVQNDLVIPSSGVNADISLSIAPGKPICNEDMASNPASIGSLSEYPCSNEPESGPPGRSTRSRTSKGPAERGSSSDGSGSLGDHDADVWGWTCTLKPVARQILRPMQLEDFGRLRLNWLQLQPC
ncbi:hypothetical protein Nepgr_013507 [Nepenthes gracilis]|uniref:Uncharacterized protein n=1 Tax=Nepenthes gracilis TaxID=150966 RepID=A0AAD3SJV8_NEPGR|nr:hypothetical protein Nepgr_013507 [Nepenthes gracilis]